MIDETVTVEPGGTTNVETYQYVIDRRSMQMVSDPRQYAFGDPKATMHAAGAYRVNFAMGTNVKGSYLAYIPEEDAVSQLMYLEGPHHHPDVPVAVIDFSSTLTGPVAPYYLAHLKAMGLPMQVTGAQLEPLLLADGIDVNQALADVGPLLTAGRVHAGLATLAKSVPLRYYFISKGLVSIEPKTGALIDVHTQRTGRGRPARPERRRRAAAVARRVRVDPVGEGAFRRLGQLATPAASCGELPLRADGCLVPRGHESRSGPRPHGEPRRRTGAVGDG